MARSISPDEKDIFELLTTDHRLVAALLDAIEKACDSEDTERARQIFETMKPKLTAHAKAEEEVVYPDLAGRSEELADLMGEAREEHRLVEDKLEELSAADPGSDEWKAKFTVLKDLVQHHVEEEEGEVFEAAGKKVKAEDAIALGERFTAAKQKILGPEAAAASEVELEAMTKEELLERAREIGLEGASKMSKAELIEAMRHGG